MWILVFISIATVSVVLWIFGRVTKKMKSPMTSENQTSDKGGFSKFGNAFKYVIYLVCNQSGSNQSSRLSIRILTGVWCLSCFVILTAYSTVLTSFFIVTPTIKPVIDSIYDIPKVPGLLVLADKDSTMSRLIIVID